MTVLVVGGGIGGLSAALLHRAGIECEAFGQSETVRELGVGINLDRVAPLAEREAIVRGYATTAGFAAVEPIAVVATAAPL